MNGFSAQVMFSNAENTTAAGKKTSLDLLNGSAAADGNAINHAPATVPGATTDAGYRVARQGEVKAAGINYTVGKFAVAYAMQDQVAFTENVESKNEITIAAATYDFGFLKAHIDQSTRKIKNAGITSADRKVMTYGVTAPVGAKLTLTAQYFDGDREAAQSGATVGVFNAATAADTKADYSGYKVRATYALSKRTGLYGQMGKTETKEAAAKTTVEGYGLGMYHTF
jgi:predicted porin